MEFEYIKLGIEALNILVTIFLFFSVQRMNKEKADTDLLNGLHNRMTSVESQLKSAPSHNDLAEMYRKINEVSDCVSSIEGKLEGSQRTLDMIQNFLITGGK